MTPYSGVYTGNKTVDTCCCCWQWKFERTWKFLLKLCLCAICSNDPQETWNSWLSFETNLKAIPLVFLERLVLLKGAVSFCQLDTLSIHKNVAGAKPDLAILVEEVGAKQGD